MSRATTGEQGEGADPQELYAEYLAQRERGIDFDTWLRGHADAEPELRALHSRMDRLDVAFEQALPGKTPPRPFFHRARRLTSPDTPLADRALGLTAGDEVGEFRLVRRLGRGGMGEVWEAVQGSLERRVALKLMLPLDDDPRRVELFAREARAGGRLSHAGIVAVHAAGVSNGLYWIAQELVEGGSTLADFLCELRAPGANDHAHVRDADRRVAELILALAEALHVAHEAGVLHRDIKPRNILVTPEGTPKLGDFGLARILDDPNRSQSGTVAGTYAYMGPEQVAGRAVERTSDIYSLGVVLYELLTGKPPFEGASTQELLGKISTQEARDPRSERASVPEELAVLCLKALEKRPADRFQDAGEFAAELRRYLADEAILTRPPGLARRARKWVRRHPTASLASGVALLALFVTGPLVARASEARRLQLQAEQSRHFEAAGRLFALSLVDAGLEEARRGIELAPDEPTGYLVAAAGLASASRLDEAEAQMRRALEAGFRPELSALVTAEDQLAFGLHVLVLRERERYAEGLRQLEAAQTDPKLAALAWYPIYQLRRTLGDLDGARAALDQFLRKVPSESPVHALLSAERLELAGEHTAALALLDELASDVRHAPEELEPLQLERSRGRILLALGRLDEARAALERAVAQNREDAASLVNLAVLAVIHIESGRGGAAEWKRAEELARRGLALNREIASGWVILGKAALARLQPRIGTLAPGEGEDWQQVAVSVERLRSFPANERAADQLQSSLDLMAGYWHQAGGRSDEAERFYADACARNDQQLLARILLGRVRCARDEYAAAFAPLEEARSLWQRGAPKGAVPADPIWHRLLHLDHFAAAARTGRVEAALASRAVLEELAAAGGLTEPMELLAFAHALATASEKELRDCASARALLDELAAWIDGVEDEAVFKALDEIAAACP